jgi:hypothetical protein
VACEDTLESTEAGTTHGEAASLEFGLTRNTREAILVETHGPLGTLWAGLGLGAFFLALTWVNLLLGHFLTPLFLIPLTWIQDAVAERKQKRG